MEQCCETAALEMLSCQLPFVHVPIANLIETANVNIRYRSWRGREPTVDISWLVSSGELQLLTAEWN